jgi:DNA-binding CsgD family transcriptional regulator
MNLKTFSQTEQQDYTARLFGIENQIKKGTYPIEIIGDYIPGSVMLQNLSTMTNEYMNRTGCEILKHSKEELRELGPEYFLLFFPPEEMRWIKNELMNFAKQRDYSKVYSFFQRARPDEKSEYKWYFTSSRLYPSDNEELPKLFHVAIEVNTLNYAGRKISHFCESDEYLRENYQRFNLLSKREKEIIKLIVEGRCTCDIADSLFISRHTVNNHRKNIIAKLDIKSLCQLTKFALEFELI